MGKGIDRKKFMTLAFSMWSGAAMVGCGPPRPVSPPPPQAAPGPGEPGHSMGPPPGEDRCIEFNATGECVRWDEPAEPTGECVDWNAADECIEWAEDGVNGPTDECVEWDATDECIKWAGPVDECVQWDPTDECIRWE